MELDERTKAEYLRYLLGQIQTYAERYEPDKRADRMHAYMANVKSGLSGEDWVYDYDQMTALGYYFLSVSLDLIKVTGSAVNDRAVSSFEIAAKVLEYLGTMVSGLQEDAREYVLLDAAISYALAGNPCGAAAVIRHIGESSEAEPDQLASVVRATLRKYLQGNFKALSPMALLSREEYGIVGEEAPGKDAGLYDGVMALMHFARYALAGGSGDWEEARALVTRSVQKLHAAGELRWFAVFERLRYVLEVQHELSIWEQLEPYKEMIPEGYMEQLATTPVGDDGAGIVQLFPAQVEAVARGVLETDRYWPLISLPTSTGKTLLAELAIVMRLNRLIGSSCIYIAPYRALAKEVYEALDGRLRPLGFRVRLVIGNYELEEQQLVDVDDADILVATPEKLDSLIRNATAYEEGGLDQGHPLSRASLIVLDECHMIDAGERGLRYELLMARLKRLIDKHVLNICLMMISAVVGNPEEIAEWLGERRGLPVYDPWRPTRLRLAIWNRDDEKVYVEPMIERRDGGYRVKYAYSVGPLPMQRRRDGRIDIVRSAADLAAAMHRIYDEPVMVVAGTKRDARSIAKYIVENHGSYFDERLQAQDAGRARLQRFAGELEQGEYYRGFSLCQFVRYGIAYHHAALAPTVKDELERMFKAREFFVLVATTTLAEGVNFPIRTVVISKYHLPEETPGQTWATAPMKPVLLRNMAGRSGRAAYHTEGHAIIVQNNIPREDFVYLVRRYLQPSREDLQVRSSLVDILREPTTRAERLADLAFRFQIVSFACENVETADQAEDLTDLTLLGKQFPEKKFEFRRRISEYLRRISEHDSLPALALGSGYGPTLFGTYVNRTGFSFETCLEYVVRIREHQNELPDAYERLREEDGSFRESILEALLGFAFLPLEIRLRRCFDRVPPEVHTALASDWMDGSTALELEDKYSPSGRGREQRLMNLYEFLQVIIQASAPWVFYGFRKMCEYFNDERSPEAPVSMSPEIGYLPLYLVYGVDSPVSLFLHRRLRIADRKLCIAVARLYDGELTYDRQFDEDLIEDWVLTRLDADTLTNILGSDQLQDVWRKVERYRARHSV